MSDHLKANPKARTSRLTISRETVRTLHVRTSIQTGLTNFKTDYVSRVPDDCSVNGPTMVTCALMAHPGHSKE